jgi:predicted RNase H-like HicB family nuclease
MRYAVVIEKAENNCSAYVPDLPGCVATGATVEETEHLFRKAIELHLIGPREDGLPIPQPTSQIEYIEVAGYRSASRSAITRSLTTEPPASGSGSVVRGSF